MAPLRRLWVLRHAKAEPSNDPHPGADHARVLTARGVTQGHALSQHFSERRAAGLPLPSVVWLSTAARTRQTAALAVADLDPVALEPEPWLYRATPEEVIARLTEIPEDPEGVMVVGHNPTVHALAFLLTGDSRLSVGFPTATLATISFAVDWAQLSEGLGDLEELWTPPGASHTGSSPAFP